VAIVATVLEVTERRLRMSELLLELGALEEEAAADSDRSHKLTVGALVDKAAEAGFGFIVGILCLIAIPFFGLSTPFGLAIALIGAQMIVGKQHPWLPQRARKRELSIHMLDKVASMLSRRTRWLVKMTRRRHEMIVAPKLVGFGITLLALGLALPLPIPGSNLVFLIPIFIYAIGLLERDGVWIAIGHACLLVDITLMFVFGATIVEVFQKLWSWIS
jgi:hypothetical protein